jgi:hypothetical protein
VNPIRTSLFSLLLPPVSNNEGFLLFWVALMLAALLFHLWHRWQMRSVDARPTQEAPEPSPDLSMESEKVNSLLLQTHPPRPVRLSRRGRSDLSLSFLLFVMLAFFCAATYHGRPLRNAMRATLPRGIGYVTPSVFGFSAVLLVLATCYGLAKEKRLVANGCVALARVSDQWTKVYGGNTRSYHSASYATYEFESAPGKIVRWSGQDPTNSLAEGMTVPVFYDPMNPKKQIAACGASYEVVLTRRA